MEQDDSQKEPQIRGFDEGADILKAVKEYEVATDEKVVYGVYDNSKKGFWLKFNDFLIDHSKVSLKDKSYFFHMLAVMVDAGIPVVKAVKALSGRSENVRFRRILNTISYNIEHGTTFSDAMSRFEDVFDDAELGIIRSGEATGQLDVVLFKLSARLDDRHELYLKLWGAAIYPIAVFSVLVLVAVGMLLWIFPTLLNLLQEGGISGDKLPFATRFLIFIQHAIVSYWWLILAVIFGFYAIFKFYVGTAYGAVKWDYLKLRLPIIGNLLKKVYVFNFIGMLGALVESGVPVINTLKISGNAIANKVYRLKIQEVINDVKAGERISESLSDSQYLFPSEVVQMIRVGEDTASIAKISEKVANQYQREINNSLKKLTSVFEPVMILTVGLFVALLALAIMAPIFNLSNAVSN